MTGQRLGAYSFDPEQLHFALKIYECANRPLFLNTRRSVSPVVFWWLALSAFRARQDVKMRAVTFWVHIPESTSFVDSCSKGSTASLFKASDVEGGKKRNIRTEYLGWMQIK